jgi:RNA polymerase sigma-70 factor, ECF subfamily
VDAQPWFFTATTLLGLQGAGRPDVERSARGGAASSRWAVRMPQERAERKVDVDEATWMAAYARGDEQAFTPLFRALAPRLQAFFRRSISDQALCEDLVQTTFVRLHAARASYELGAPVRPWLFTIAARVRVDELRRRQRRVATTGDGDLDRVSAETDVASDFEAGDGLDERARQATVREAIDALAPGYRIVVHLHRFEGLSFPEIAKVLGCTAGAARIRAFRAYAILRERLGPLLKEHK